MMTLTDRIDLLSELGNQIQGFQTPEWEALFYKAQQQNPWFTVESIQRALKAIRDQFLQKSALQEWVKSYPMDNIRTPRDIGLVMAGNIPLAGFHDFLSAFIAGHRALIKLSDKDPYLLPFLIKKMVELYPGAQEYVELVERLLGFDGVIATGSNNSARYFESYFSKYPHIIRKNRNGVAVLSGSESDTQLNRLGEDIFSYFGLGCRNVSKIYVPKGFDFQPLLNCMDAYQHLELHNKYKNNFDYNLALFLLNREPYLASKVLILKEDSSFLSRIATLHYEYYDSLPTVISDLQGATDKWQCIVSAGDLDGLPVVGFGEAQLPGLRDYPDGADLLEFLTGNQFV